MSACPTAVTVSHHFKLQPKFPLFSTAALISHYFQLPPSLPTISNCHPYFPQIFHHNPRFPLHLFFPYFSLLLLLPAFSNCHPYSHNSHAVLFSHCYPIFPLFPLTAAPLTSHNSHFPLFPLAPLFPTVAFTSYMLLYPPLILYSHPAGCA
jgi:hypothetical protein